ncbi:MAG: hypothetical protein ABIP06_09925 [Pyrinomonadaceae bacterium]
MNKSYIWISVLAVLTAFAGGFLLANALNKKELFNLKTENERLKSASPTSEDSQERELSDEEIKQKIAEADKNPDNFAFQKSLGIGLYRYATIKQNPGLLLEVERILNRAYQLNPKDQEVLVFYGNTVFDVGFAKKENAKFELARKLYSQALVQQPKDVDIQTDLGLTYFYENPPQDEKAIPELQKSLAINPDHERSLQYLAQIYARKNDQAEMEKYLSKLKQINPQNQFIKELQTPLSEKTNQ